MTSVTHAQLNLRPSSRSRGYVSPRLVPPLAIASGLIAYAVILRIGPLEALRWLVGIIALWGPLTALTFAWLRDEIPDRLPRATFAAIVGYALTTLLYFLCGVVAGPWLFYLLQLAIVAVAVQLWRRAPRLPISSTDPAPRASGWTLALLIVVSLLVLSRFQVAERTDPATGDVRFVACLEQTYFAGQSYELARHTPPVQQAVQAGAPERAYHLLPHLAAMLNARFGGLADFLRAHLVYHYALITVLLCLALYSIAWRITGTRLAGYVALCLLVILEIPLPPAVPTPLGYFHFNLFPVATSVLQPTVITSPQMYSGLVPTFGVLLGAVYLCHGLRHNRNVGRIAIACAALAAATARFRVQVFLPLMPGFMLLLAYVWWRSRGRGLDRWLVAAAAFVAVGLSAVLYLETRRRVYLHDTANLQFGFYPNHRMWMDAWPGADAILRFLQQWLLPDKVPLVWSVIAIVGFAFLNAMGIPTVLAAIAWLARRPAWREWGGYAGLTVWLVAASILGALTVRVGYDDYSVGGQMLLHTGWYTLPLLGIVIASILTWTIRVTRANATLCTAAGLAAVAAAAVYQGVRPPDKLEQMTAAQSVVMPRNDWLAIQYLHDKTPARSVVISNHHLEPNAAIYPGVAGRASFLSYVYSVTNLYPPVGRNPGPKRPGIIDQLWSERNPERFASLLATTGATHLVEFSDRPLNIRRYDGLRLVWVSPKTTDPNAVRVRIYEAPRPAKKAKATTTTAPAAKNPATRGS